MYKYLVIYAVLDLIIVITNSEPHLDLYNECAKYYHPGNYMSHLPSLNLPYTGDVPIPINVGISDDGTSGEGVVGLPGANGDLLNPENLLVPGHIGVPGLKIPNNAPIQPSPVMKTKAISIVTKYIYKNPVCVKFSKGKSMCKKDGYVELKNGYEKLVTKEYFVKDRSYDGRSNERNGRLLEDDLIERITENKEDADYNYIDLHLESSESPRPFTKNMKKTPTLSKQQIHEMLIEDRLNQLETILPHYTRRRVFETSTITVTKVVSNKRSMATLVVKNCIPYGFDLCESKSKYRQGRKSKVAKFSNNTNENGFYFG